MSDSNSDPGMGFEKYEPAEYPEGAMGILATVMGIHNSGHDPVRRSEIVRSASTPGDKDAYQYCRYRLDALADGGVLERRSEIADDGSRRRLYTVSDGYRSDAHRATQLSNTFDSRDAEDTATVGDLADLAARVSAFEAATSHASQGVYVLTTDGVNTLSDALESAARSDVSQTQDHIDNLWDEVYPIDIVRFD